MKMKEIKKLTTDQLKTKVSAIKKDLFNIRFRKANGQMENTAKVSELKKDVAKILTMMKKNK